MIEKKEYSLGTIELGSNVIVSDPCYDLGTWCTKVLEGNVKPGKYYGFMKKSDFGDGGFGGVRVTDLWIVHEDDLDVYPNEYDKDADIGVDSGAAGIYDLDYFKEHHPIGEDGENEEWYDRQFNLRYYYDINGKKIVEKMHPTEYYFYTEQERADGIALDNKCVISFSGFGDGGYALYTAKDEDDKIVGIRIEFVPDNYDEEEDYE